MSSEVILQTPDAVTAAFASPFLVPPAAPATLTPGPTADLRAAMARFSSGADHRERRLTVEAAIGRLHLGRLGNDAATETTAILDDALDHQGLGQGDGRLDAIADLAFTVPTLAMARSLGIAAASLADVVSDVGAIVAVIGRGEPSSAESDAATSRLLDLLGAADDSVRAVAAASLLYQNHDATAALVAATLVAIHTGQPQRGALPKTVRVATEQTTIDRTTISSGQVVIVPIESPEHHFGSGVHHCPGREQAETIVAAIVDAISQSVYTVTADAIVYGDDGRATAIPIEPVPNHIPNPAEATD